MRALELLLQVLVTSGLLANHCSSPAPTCVG